MQEDGFEFDFEVASVSFVAYLFEPQKSQGWIGPYDFEKSDFTWDDFYRKLSILELYNLYVEFLSSGQYTDVNSVFIIYQEKLSSYNDSLSLDSLHEKKSVLFEMENLQTFQNDTEQNHEDKKYIRGLWRIFDFKLNLIETKIKKSLEEVSLEEMNKTELEIILTDAIAKSDFELAAKIRDLIVSNSKEV